MSSRGDFRGNKQKKIGQKTQREIIVDNDCDNNQVSRDSLTITPYDKINEDSKMKGLEETSI